MWSSNLPDSVHTVASVTKPQPRHGHSRFIRSVVTMPACEGQWNVRTCPACSCILMGAQEHRKCRISDALPSWSAAWKDLVCCINLHWKWALSPLSIQVGMVLLFAGVVPTPLCHYWEGVVVERADCASLSATAFCCLCGVYLQLVPGTFKGYHKSGCIHAGESAICTLCSPLHVVIVLCDIVFDSEQGMCLLSIGFMFITVACDFVLLPRSIVPWFRFSMLVLSVC